MPRIKQHLPVVVAVLATASLTLGAPAVAHGVHALFAHNADKVDGIHASKKPRARRLLPLNKNKRFPTRVMPRVADSVTVPVAAMEALGYSEHNDGLNVACGAEETSNIGGENGGDRDGSTGSFVGALSLPNGARVTKVDLIVNDGDEGDDVFAYLVRRDLKPNSPAFEGYSVMATVQSTGALVATVRRFSDSTIESAVVNNGRYMYFVEVVDCGVPEPFGVRVTYS